MNEDDETKGGGTRGSNCDPVAKGGKGTVGVLSRGGGAGGGTTGVMGAERVGLDTATCRGEGATVMGRSGAEGCVAEEDAAASLASCILQKSEKLFTGSR